MFYHVFKAKLAWSIMIQLIIIEIILPWNFFIFKLILHGGGEIFISPLFWKVIGRILETRIFPTHFRWNFSQRFVKIISRHNIGAAAIEAYFWRARNWTRQAVCAKTWQPVRIGFCCFFYYHAIIHITSSFFALNRRWILKPPFSGGY